MTVGVAGCGPGGPYRCPVVGPRRVAAALLGASLLAAGPAAGAGAAAQRTWHADQARVPDARAAGQAGAGVTVAVLDTWIDAGHPDFEGRVVTGADCSDGTCREGSPTPDACTHGTHVAGTVASSSYGVATRASILPVKVLSYSPPGVGQASGSCSGSVTAVAAGIRYAVSRGARVLNLSLGTLVPGLSSSSEIAGAVADAARADAVVVFAAGNSRVPVADSYGGNALIVAATGPTGDLATYSQRGVGVSMAAPGGDPGTFGDCTPSTCVTSLYPGGRYAVVAGTSMAAPHVAGTAALLLAQDPRRSRGQVVDRLLSTTRDVPGGGAGRGLLDATAALSGPVAALPGPVGDRAAAPPAVTSRPRTPPGTTAPVARGAAPRPASSSSPAGEPIAPQPLPAAGGPASTAAETILRDTSGAAGQGRTPLPAAPPVVAAALLVAAATSTVFVRRSLPGRR